MDSKAAESVPAQGHGTTVRPGDLEAEVVQIDSLIPYPGNARQGDIGAICQSLQAHGQYRPLVVQRSTGYVLAGNHTLAAAKQLGWSEVAVTRLDVDDEQAKRIVLVDNRTQDLATNDDDALAALLQDLAATTDGLTGTGFDGDDLDDLLADLERGGADPESDGAGADTEPGEPPAEPRTKPGDVWVLGEHRLACGDSTDPLLVDRLLAGERVDMVFTDPPYGIAYKDVAGRHRPIANDEADPRDLVRDALALYGLDGDTPTYVCCDWRSLGAMVDALEAVGVKPKATIVWDKERRVQNLDRYFKQHEFIVYAGPYGGQETLRGDVWRIPREPNPGDHPTPKPVDLIEMALGDSAAARALVVDPFGGSGSTLIAAENIGRRARLVELDPRYCDVIVDRWERHTGGTAVLEGDGDA